MPDYSKGKIYTIRCKTDDTKIYVGSTVQPLSCRWGGHNRDYYGDIKHSLLFRTIRENGGIENWYIELFELFSCNSKIELNKREGEVIRSIGTLNTNIAGNAGRIQTVYRDENRQEYNEYMKIYMKQAREKNPEYYKEQNRKHLKAYTERKLSRLEQK
jgi:hypothetical protein